MSNWIPDEKATAVDGFAQLFLHLNHTIIEAWNWNRMISSFEFQIVKGIYSKASAIKKVCQIRLKAWQMPKKILLLAQIVNTI